MIIYDYTYVEPGYEKIPVDLNEGAGGKYVWLTFQNGTCEAVMVGFWY